MKTILTIILVVLLCTLAACMTSSSEGSLFEQTVKSDKKAVPAEKDAITSSHTGVFKEDPKPEPVLSLITSPEEARIYVNNIYQGNSPLQLKDLTPGSYKITASKTGYYEETFWIDYRGGTEEYNILLVEITGYLAIYTQVADARITVGDLEYSFTPLKIRIGNHPVKIKAFGYEEFSGYVEILEDQTTELNVQLQEARFALQELHLSRSILNPDNAGLLGTVTIMFRVTSWGSGSLVILDNENNDVFHYDFPEFGTWDQAYRWDGRDYLGRKLADGSYRILLQGTGSKEGEESRQETGLTIDRSYVITFRIPWSGVSGLIYAATPGILPPWSFQLSYHSFLAMARDSEGQLLYRAPQNTGLRLGIPGRGELDISLSPIITDNPLVPFTLSGAYKWRLFATGSHRRFSGALFGRASYVYGTNADTYTNFTGLSIGLPLALESGMVSLVADPELVISPFRPLYGSAENQSPGFYTWLYAKLGLILDTGPVIAALSGSLRSGSFTEGWRIDYPLNLAAELHLLIPHTQLFFTTAAALEFINTDDYYINAGIGISVLH